MTANRRAALFSSILVILLLTGGCADIDGTPTAAPESADLKYIAKGEPTGEYWPTKGWRSCRPEAVGMDSAKLAKVISYVAEPAFKTEGFLVVKDGYIVAEAYFGNFQKDDRHVSNSMAKSFTSSLIGIAIDKGLIPGVDAKLCGYYEDWNCGDKDDLRSKITIRHALTLTSGLKWHEDWSKFDYNTNDALKMGASGYFVKYMSDRVGQHEPGTRFNYSTGDPMLLSKVIKEATGMPAYDFARKNLFEPLNIANVSWDRDRDGYTATAWGLYTTVREFAKFGYLYLNKGKWEDKQIVSEEWVDVSTRTDPSVQMWQAYAYLWHINFPMRTRTAATRIPADGFMAEGVQGQKIMIIPSKDLVVVKVAATGSTHPDLDLKRFLTLTLDAIRE
jgi:CubicO group peptidase (beta-lactamase class C family)